MREIFTKGCWNFSKKGQIIEKPEDIIRNPYVLEFLGLPDDEPSKESDLEKGIV
jgi:predicted nuclease of restriction endonuclease-like (RecB) superfamily